MIPIITGVKARMVRVATFPLPLSLDGGLAASFPFLKGCTSSHPLADEMLPPLPTLPLPVTPLREVFLPVLLILLLQGSPSSSSSSFRGALPPPLSFFRGELPPPLRPPLYGPLPPPP